MAEGVDVALEHEPKAIAGLSAPSSGEAQRQKPYRESLLEWSQSKRKPTSARKNL